MQLAGHAWTIAPPLLERLRPTPAPAAEPWTTVVDDPRVGPVQLHGKLRHEPTGAASGGDCLVVIHGLGGTTDTPYTLAAAQAAGRLGMSCLRLCLRGAARRGQDFYHAGLTADLSAALASPALRRFERIWVLGFSLGGHMTLRYALRPDDPRVRAVAAVCPPLDLERSATAIDQLRNRIYLKYLLAGLNEIYAIAASTGRAPTPLARVRRARSIREWDGLTIAPRFGFDSAEDYYAQMSVGPRLAELSLPALIVQSTADPMVPPWTYADALRPALPGVVVRRLSAGGHVAFPRGLDLDLGQPQSDEMLDQVLGWLREQT